MMLPHSLNGDDDSILQNLLDDADADDEDSSMMLGAWVPVGSCSSLQGLVPTEVEIMGHKFAIWKADSDGDGSSSHWSVVDDECPHRMAPLSLGRIDPITQCLECPFHGWQFDCNGTVRSIPQLDELDDAESNTAVNHKKADVRSVRSFPTHVTGDLLWMFLPTSFHGESFPLTLMPEDYYQGLGNFMGPRDSLYASDLPFSFDFLVEK
jgi:phenylpropionate dioxygenase-like ring-hydroxylating dioxygenase large terminal subunit